MVKVPTANLCISLRAVSAEGSGGLSGPNDRVAVSVELQRRAIWRRHGSADVRN